MRIDGIQLVEGSTIKNDVVDSGTSFPSLPNVGELFFLTISPQGLYVYDGSVWNQVGLGSVTAANTAAGNSDLYITNTAGGDVYSLNVVNFDIGTFGSTTLIPVITVNEKGLITAVSTATASGFNTASNQSITGSWTFTNPVTGALPTASNHLATKQYVDNATGSNISISTSQVTSGTFADARFASSNIVQFQSNLTIAESQISNGTLLARVGDNEVVTGNWTFNTPVTGVTPTTSLQFATKQYVDDVASGLTVHAAVRAATTGPLTATYNNGSSGVGATLTGTGALPTIDGVTLSVGNRVLVKDQALSLQNGIYVVTTTSGNWVLTRSSDFDNSPVGEIVAGSSTYVQEGGQNASQWVQTTSGTISPGASQIVFTQFGGAGSYTAGSGISIIGSTISNTGVTSLTGGTGITLTNTAGDITISASGVTSVQASGGTTGLTFTGGPVTTTGTLTLGGVLGIANGGTGQTTLSASLNALLPSQTGLSGRYLTTNGTSASWATINAGTVTSVALGLPSMFTVTGSPVTTSGTLSATLASQSTGTFLAAPAANSGTPTFRNIAVSDVPTLNQNTTGTAGGLSVTLPITQGGTGATSVAGALANILPATSGNLNKVLTINGTVGVSWQFPDAFYLSGGTLASSILYSSLQHVGTLTDLTVGTTASGYDSIYAGGSISIDAQANEIHANEGNFSLKLGYLNTSISSTSDAFVAYSGAGTDLSVTPSRGVGNLILRPRYNLSISLVTQDQSRLWINYAGAFGLNGANYGTVGQVMTSNGGAATPSWETIVAPASTLTGTTIASNVIHSSLTSVGTLATLTVTAPIAGSITGNAGSATVLDTARTINGVSFDGSANITVAAAAGTLTGTSLAGNVVSSSLTSVGTLTNLSVTNPISGSVSGSAATLTTARTINGVSFDGSSNITVPAATLSTPRTINGVAFDGSANITITAAAGTLTGATLNSSVVNSSLTSVGTLGTLTVSGNVSASDPTTSSHLATKNYVDNAIAGLSWKNAVLAGTTTNITLSGAQTIDGVAVVAGDRVLVKNQTTAAQNGIYVVASGAWTRSTDFNSVAEINGAAVYIESGTLNGNSTWTVAANIATLGTDDITFAQLSAAVSVSASSLTGTTLASNVVTSSLTSVGTLGSLTVTGGASAGSFTGAGTGLTGTAAALNIGGNSATSTLAASATKLATARAINGVAFDGTAAITVTAAAGTLTGSSLNSTVTGSSLTSVGTISSGTWQGTPIANAYLANSSITINGTLISLGGSGSFSADAGALTGTTLASNVVNSSLTSVGALTALEVATGTGIPLGGTTGSIRIGYIDGTMTSIQDIYVGWGSANASASQVVGGNGTLVLAGRNNSNTGISLVTGGSSRFYINYLGAIGINGANYGTSGQVLSSLGSSGVQWTSNVPTATALATARTINGVSFDGSANITVTAAAGTLTGTTLNSSVTASSLTSVGTLSSLTVANGGAVNLGTTSSNGASLVIGGSSGGGIEIQQSGPVPLNSTAGTLRIGYLNGAFTSVDDAFVGWASSNTAQSVGTNGTLVLAGRNNAGTGVSLVTGNTSRLYINNAGAFGLNGANYGTSGQVLTSNGSTGAPSWQAPGSAAAGALTGTTLASNVVSSSLTSVGTLLNLTVTNTIVGNAATATLAAAATKLNTARTINGTSFDGTANITVTADASTLTGTSLNSTVTASSLTSVGNLTSLRVNAAAVASGATVQVGTSGSVGASSSSTVVLADMSSTGTTQLRYLFNHTGSGYLGMGGNDSTIFFGSTPSIGSQFPTSWLDITSSVVLVPSALNVRGTIQLNGSTGTSGQVLTSNGTSAPTWQSASTVAAAGTLTGTTLASNVVSSSLTSVGTLGSLTVTGGVSAGSFTGAGTGLTGTAASLSIGGNAATATTAASATALATARTINGTSFDGTANITVTAAAGTLTGTALASNVVTSSLTMLGTQSGALNMGGFAITNAGAPSNGSDVATKNYVDSAVAGLSWKTAVKAATTANVTLSGAQTIDGVSLVAGDRVLVKNQTTASANGIYVVSASTWSRATDIDTAAELDGAAVYVQQGTTQADTAWTETATVVTLGTDAVTFAQFNGGASYTAGTGISLSGNTFSNTGVTSIAGTANQITASASTGAVTLSLPSSINVNAATATALQTARTINGTSFDGSANITVTAAAGTLTGTTLNSTVTASSLTSVGTLSSLTVSGITSINGIGATYSATRTTSTTAANAIIDNSLAIASYRSVKYQISITSGTEYQFTEVTLIHDGTNVFMTENGTVQTGASLATFTADINVSGFLRLLSTPTNAVTTYKVIAVAIAV